MHRNRDLHDYLLNKAKVLTEEWYESLDKKILREYMLQQTRRLLKR